MCITTPLQQKIIDRTEEGDTIAAFLVDTMRGKTPASKSATAWTQQST